MVSTSEENKPKYSLLSHEKLSVKMHLDDAKDRQFVAIVKTLLVLGNTPTSPQELSALIPEASPEAISSVVSKNQMKCVSNGRKPLLGKMDDGLGTRRFYILHKGVPVKYPQNQEVTIPDTTANPLQQQQQNLSMFNNPSMFASLFSQKTEQEPITNPWDCPFFDASAAASTRINRASSISMKPFILNSSMPPSSSFSSTETSNTTLNELLPFTSPLLFPTFIKKNEDDTDLKGMSELELDEFFKNEKVVSSTSKPKITKEKEISCATTEQQLFKPYTPASVMSKPISPPKNQHAKPSSPPKNTKNVTVDTKAKTIAKKSSVEEKAVESDESEQEVIPKRPKRKATRIRDSQSPTSDDDAFAISSFINLDDNGDNEGSQDNKQEENDEIDEEKKNDKESFSFDNVDPQDSKDIPIHLDPSTLNLDVQSLPNKTPPNTSTIFITSIEEVDMYLIWLVDSDNGTRVPLLRRVDSGMVNATLLLYAGGMHTEKERSVVLSFEHQRIRYKGDKLVGAWIPLHRAQDLARSLCLEKKLHFFLSDTIKRDYFHDVTQKKRGAYKAKKSKTYEPRGSSRRVAKKPTVTQAPPPPQPAPTTKTPAPGDYSNSAFAFLSALTSSLANVSTNTASQITTKPLPNTSAPSPNIQQQPQQQSASQSSNQLNFYLAFAEAIASKLATSGKLPGTATSGNGQQIQHQQQLLNQTQQSNPPFNPIQHLFANAQLTSQPLFPTTSKTTTVSTNPLSFASIQQQRKPSIPSLFTKPSTTPKSPTLHKPKTRVSNQLKRKLNVYSSDSAVDSDDDEEEEFDSEASSDVSSSSSEEEASTNKRYRVGRPTKEEAEERRRLKDRQEAKGTKKKQKRDYFG